MARMLTLRSLLVLASLSLASLCGMQTSKAAIVLTPGGDATNVTSVGLDTTTGPARASIAPAFPGDLTLLPDAQIAVVGTGDLTPNYAIGFINDGTGYNFLSDSVTASGVPGTNRGWIPDSTGIETATFTFAAPIRLNGVDFLTLFNSRTAGSFTFEFSNNNQATWLSLASLTNDNNADVFRQGFTFDPINGVTDVRLITDATGAQLFIGEVDFYTSIQPVPEPSTLALFSMAAAALAVHRRRSLPRSR